MAAKLSSWSPQAAQTNRNASQSVLHAATRAKACCCSDIWRCAVTAISDLIPSGKTISDVSVSAMQNSEKFNFELTVAKTLTFNIFHNLKQIGHDLTLFRLKLLYSCILTSRSCTCIQYFPRQAIAFMHRRLGWLRPLHPSTLRLRCLSQWRCVIQKH